MNEPVLPKVTRLRRSVLALVAGELRHEDENSGMFPLFVRFERCTLGECLGAGVAFKGARFRMEILNVSCQRIFCGETRFAEMAEILFYVLRLGVHGLGVTFRGIETAELLGAEFTFIRPWLWLWLWLEVPHANVRQSKVLAREHEAAMRTRECWHRFCSIHHQMTSVFLILNRFQLSEILYVL